MQGNYPSLLDPGMLTLAWNSFGHYTFSSVAKLGGVQKREMKKEVEKAWPENKSQSRDF